MFRDQFCRFLTTLWKYLWRPEIGNSLEKWTDIQLLWISNFLLQLLSYFVSFSDSDISPFSLEWRRTKISKHFFTQYGYHLVDLIEINPNIYNMLVFNHVKVSKLSKIVHLVKSYQHGNKTHFSVVYLIKVNLYLY